MTPKSVNYYFDVFLCVDLVELFHIQDKFRHSTPFLPFLSTGILHMHHVLSVEEMVYLYFFSEDNFGNMGRTSLNKQSEMSGLQHMQLSQL